VQAHGADDVLEVRGGHCVLLVEGTPQVSEFLHPIGIQVAEAEHPDVGRPRLGQQRILHVFSTRSTSVGCCTSEFPAFQGPRLSCASDCTHRYPTQGRRHEKRGARHLFVERNSIFSVVGWGGECEWGRRIVWSGSRPESMWACVNQPKL